jgi:hypothetical protein
VQVAKSAPFWRLRGNHIVAICRNWSAPRWRRIRDGTRTCPWLQTPTGWSVMQGGAAAQAGRSVRPNAGARRSAGPEGKFPLIDRGMVLVSMAVAIALGVRSMRDIAVLAHQEPVVGAAPSDTTVRRTLELADARTMDKIARPARRVPAHVWQLIRARPAGSRGWPSPGSCWRLAGHRPRRDADHRGAATRKGPPYV